MMALTKRRIPQSGTNKTRFRGFGSEDISGENNNNDNNNNKGGNNTKRNVKLAVIAIGFTIFLGTAMKNFSSSFSSIKNTATTNSSLKGSSSGISGTVFEIGNDDDNSKSNGKNGVRLVIDFAGETKTDTTGVVVVSSFLGTTHKVEMIIDDPSSCSNPALWLRLEGAALVGIVLYEEKNVVGGSSSNNNNRWVGSFDLPIPGNYQLVSYFYGCDGKGPKQQQQKVLAEIIAQQGEPKNTQNGGAGSSNSFTENINPQSTFLDFPSSTWVQSKQFLHDISQPYIWHDPSSTADKPKLLKTSNTTLSQQGTVGVGDESENFFKFKELGNYELVCFFGSDSAEALRSTFFQIRPMLFSHQRPFKFHIYPSRNFERPDRDWTEETKKRLRKCKHILVSYDELEETTTTPSSLSQKEYTEQVTTFLNHLLKVIPDDTFPIWMFSVMESPIQAAAATTTSTNNSFCHSPFLPRSSHHPCNDALKELFRNSPFPDRVRFLDNTDVSFPQFVGGNKDDILGVVALRIFAIVGKQVQIWRDNGQQGTISGLVRNGKTEPNFELVPYTGWS